MKLDNTNPVDLIPVIWLQNEEVNWNNLIYNCNKPTKLLAFSPQENYTDRASAANFCG
jgi:hypothetical protein